MSKGLIDYSKLLHVLDSTAFIGLDFPILQSIEVKKFLTAHSVIEELKDFRSRMNFDVMLQTNKLEVSSPNPQNFKKLKMKIHKIDPNTRLSDTDIQVLTLAWQEKGVLVTNDLTLQNIAEQLKVTTRVISGKGIKVIRKSRLRCMSCKRTFRVSGQHCPECGGVLKQYFSTSNSNNLLGKE